MERLKSTIIQESRGKQFVIPDIHACYYTFESLLEKIDLKKNDQLILLGDYIDRGEHSGKVLDLLIELISSGYQIYPIKGNHEEGLLHMNECRHLLWNFNKIDDYVQEGLFDAKNKLKDKYFHFLSGLPCFFETECFIFVHAGFDFSSPNPFENFEAMLQIRNFRYNEVLAKNKTIIHGHDPQTLSFIQNTIKQESKIIPLDNGCVFKEIAGMGNLLCLETCTMELFIQENID